MALTLLTRRDPFADFDAMIRRAFPAPAAARGGSTVRPALQLAADVARDGDDALIRLDAPGLDFARDIDVELDGSTLTISGERRDERADSSQDAGATRALSEVRYGSFRRAFTLPEQVAAEQVSASYDAGVLSVRIEGAYAGTEPTKITVTAAQVPTTPVATATAEAQI